MKVDYSKGKIYKITNDYNDDIYIGSTCDTLVKRFSKHRRDIKNDEKKHRKLYVAMNDIGFDRFRIELVEECPCDDKYQLRQREGYYIRQIGTLNIVIAGRTQQEYNEDNKEHLKQKKKDYQLENKQKIQEYKKQYRAENHETITKNMQMWREKNRDKINEDRNQYYYKNKDKILETMSIKITCECGCIMRNDVLKRHQKTQKHIDLMNSKNTESN